MPPRSPVQAGPGRLFTGIRSDPFFADADGSFHGFRWTGQDAFANRNIPSIVLEVPNDMLGADSAIGVWATVSVRRDGALVQVDRGGHPTINPFINPNNVKNQYNLRQPADDLANYLAAVVQAAGRQRLLVQQAEAAAARSCCPTSCATTAAARPLPQRPGPDRRRVQRPLRLADQRQGRPQGLKPHDDLLAEFPFLGPPNRYTAG